MTRTVADSALMLTVMNEPDARDWYAVPGDGADLRRACTASVKGWRIAYSPLLGNRSVHPEVAALVKAAAEALVDLELGRASGRGRECQYVYISVGAVSLKKKKH